MDLEVIKLAASIAMPFMLLAIATGIGLIRYFAQKLARDIKDDFNKLESRLQDNHEKVNQVERDFMNFKADLPRSFVLRDDYIRITSVMERRIDSVSKSVDSMNTHVSELASEIQLQGKDIKIMLNRLGGDDAYRADKD